MAKNTKDAPVERSVSVYTKEQLRLAHRYAASRDLISALLEDGKTYTLVEVDKLIDNYLKGEVK